MKLLDLSKYVHLQCSNYAFNKRLYLNPASIVTVSSGAMANLDKTIYTCITLSSGSPGAINNNSGIYLAGDHVGEILDALEAL